MSEDDVMKKFLVRFEQLASESTRIEETTEVIHSEFTGNYQLVDEYMLNV